VAEIQRCREIGHRAILFTSAPQDFGMPLLGDPHSPLESHLERRPGGRPPHQPAHRKWRLPGPAPESRALRRTRHRPDHGFGIDVRPPRQRDPADGRDDVGDPAAQSAAPSRLRRERDRVAALREGSPRPRLRLHERPDRAPRSGPASTCASRSGPAPSSRSSPSGTSWTRSEPIASCSRPTIPIPSACMETKSARRSTRPSAICRSRFATGSSSPTRPSCTGWALPIGRGRAGRLVPRAIR
jgi:hypothetical protein